MEKIAKDIGLIINKNFSKLDNVWRNVGYSIDENNFISFGFHGLQINDNELYKLVNEISAIDKIDFLDIGENAISNISCLNKLGSISRLRIEDNRIEDISVLKRFVNLKSLYASKNLIKDISSLKEKKHLNYIDLDQNYISDIEPLKYSLPIQHVNLLDNPIQKINSWVFEVKRVEFHSGPHAYGYGDGLFWYLPDSISSPPIEIIKRGKESVLSWYVAEKKKLNEIKIILIGDPKSGKTSLLRRLKYNSFDRAEIQTDGVNIENIEFCNCNTFKNQKSLHALTGHFWDFGGQEIMNATHQFFLTKRSIYVLVLDARKDANNSSQIRNWVKRIKATGGDSPIIVLANQIDVNPGFGFENERELQNEFPQIKIFLKVSCSTNENIDLFKYKLEELIPTAELFKTDIDKRWLEIKEKLEKETKANYFLDETRFLKICNEVKLIHKREQNNAIAFLHDLGQVLHFDDLNLSEYYVLDPYWITYGVYQILTSAYVSKMKGIVSMDKLEYIVNEEEAKTEIYNPSDYKKIEYSHFQRRFLIDILHQFKLCFCFVDHSYFIIPDLLDTKEPLDITEPIRVSENNIQFVYEYEYLPKSVMPNIMVDTHQIITHMWRTGCVLEHSGSEALITNYRNRISIIVNGEYKKKREFMSVIRFIIDSVNQKLSNKPVTLIPLPTINAFAEYERLLTREKKGKTEYIFDEDKQTERKFLISELLDGVPSNEDIKDAGEKFAEVLNKLDRLKYDIEIIKENQEEIIITLNSHYEYLINLPENKSVKDDILMLINEMSVKQTSEIVTEIMKMLEITFEESNIEIDNKFKNIYNDLKKTDDVQTKLKLSIPFINIIGINLETEFDIKSWTKKMYNKYELKIFQLMGYL